MQSSRALGALEQRYYSNRSLWRIADIGGAVFADVGRTWGDRSLGPQEPQTLLKDIGIGLRLGASNLARQRAAYRPRLPARRGGLDRRRPVADPDEAQFLTMAAVQRDAGADRHEAILVAAFLVAGGGLPPCGHSQYTAWISIAGSPGPGFSTRTHRPGSVQADGGRISLIHRGGSALVWTIGLCGDRHRARRTPGSVKLRPYRRKAAYLVVGMALCATVVGVLKLATNVDCPRDLEGFGGTHPYVQLFEDRPDGLPRGRCFPGSHASTGFALMGFLFRAFRHQSHGRLASCSALAVALGTIFSIGQQSARVPISCPTTSRALALAWFELLGLWWLLLRSPAAKSRLIRTGPPVQPPGYERPARSGT